MDFIIKLPASLDLTAAEIIHQWNASEDFTEIAIARPVEKTQQKYAAITLNDVYVILGATSVNVASSVIYDLLKSLIIKSKSLDANRIEFGEKQNPDHTRSIEIMVADQKNNLTSNQ